MRRFMFLAAALVATAAWADLKLGYVDLTRAMTEIGEGQLADARLKTELDKRKSEFEAEQNKLRDDSVVLEKQRAMMSEEVRNQKLAELQKRLFELSQKGEKLQTELAEKRRVELKKIFDKIDPIIKAIAEREGLTMVFEKTDSGLVYAPTSLDVTNELVRTYNDRYPVKAGGKGATAKAPASKEGAKEAPKDAPTAAKDAPKDPPADKK